MKLTSEYRGNQCLDLLPYGRGLSEVGDWKNVRERYWLAAPSSGTLRCGYLAKSAFICLLCQPRSVADESRCLRLATAGRLRGVGSLEPEVAGDGVT